MYSVHQSPTQTLIKKQTKELHIHAEKGGVDWSKVPNDVLLQVKQAYALVDDKSKQHEEEDSDDNNVVDVESEEVDK